MFCIAVTPTPTCTNQVPDIENGMVDPALSDSDPYFVGESIVYECNNNYDADGADLTNECIENTGGGDTAVWSRMTGDLTDICLAGI